MTVKVLEQLNIHVMDASITYFESQYPSRTVLLAMDVADGAYGGPILANPAVTDQTAQTLMAVRPEELRKLARQLEKAADHMGQK